MCPQLSDDISSYYQQCYQTFEKYMHNVESAFLNDEDLSGKELHRGKHFLAHGVVGLLEATENHLFGLLQEKNPDHETCALQTLHEHCTEVIRELHDSINLLSNLEADPAKRSEQPRKILRHLHQIDALLGSILDVANEVYTKGLLDDLPENDRNELIAKFNNTLEENRTCSRFS